MSGKKEEMQRVLSHDDTPIPDVICMEYISDSEGSLLDRDFDDDNVDAIGVEIVESKIGSRYSNQDSGLLLIEDES